MLISAGEIFLSGLRGAKFFFGRVSDRFLDLFSRFSNRFSYRFKSFSGAVSFCRHATLSVSTGVWCVPGFDAGLEVLKSPSNGVKPSKLQKISRKSWRRALLSPAPKPLMHQTVDQKRSELRRVD